MKNFIWFVLALIALIVLFTNIGPMIVLGVSLFLLYLVFQQFIKTQSVVGRVAWVILGLIILSVALSNMYAIIGIVAIVFLYFIYKKYQEDKEMTFKKHSNA